MWFSPKLFKDRYGLSDDTRAKGMNGLHTLGLISIARQPVNPDDFDIERVRNTYTLYPIVLQEPARRRPPTRVATAADWVNHRLTEKILGAKTVEEVFAAAGEVTDLLVPKRLRTRSAGTEDGDAPNRPE